MNQEAKFCSDCATPLGKKDHFCPVCGAKVVDENEQNQEKSSIKTSPTSPPLRENKKESKNNSQSTKTETHPLQQNKGKPKFKLWVTLPATVILLIASYSLFIVFQTGGNLLPFVDAVSFSPIDNNKLVSAGSDNHLEIWDITQGKSVKRKKFTSGWSTNHALTWSQNNHIIALASANPNLQYNEIILFDPSTLNQISSFSTGKSVSIALCIDPGGEILYSVTQRLGISVWDINEGKRLGGLEDLPHRLVNSASFDGDCQKIATIEGITQTKNGFDVRDEKFIVYQRINMDTLFQKKYDGTYPVGDDNIVGLDFNGKVVNTITDYGKKLKSWDITSYRKTETTLGISDRFSTMSLAMRKGRHFAVGYSGGLIDIFNNNGGHEQTLQHGPGLGIVLSPILNYFD